MKQLQWGVFSSKGVPVIQIQMYETKSHNHFNRGLVWMLRFTFISQHAHQIHVEVIIIEWSYLSHNNGTFLYFQQHLFVWTFIWHSGSNFELWIDSSRSFCMLYWGLFYMLIWASGVLNGHSLPMFCSTAGKFQGLPLRWKTNENECLISTGFYFKTFSPYDGTILTFFALRTQHETPASETMMPHPHPTATHHSFSTKCTCHHLPPDDICALQDLLTFHRACKAEMSHWLRTAKVTIRVPSRLS